MGQMELGQRITFYRKKQGMTKRELATKIGVSESYIGKLEKGACINPSTEMLMKLSNLFTCSITSLLGTDEGLVRKTNMARFNDFLPKDIQEWIERNNERAVKHIYLAKAIEEKAMSTQQIKAIIELLLEDR